MSWQEYVDKNLIGAGVGSRAALVGVDGTMLASSPGFQISKGEVKDMVTGFEDPSQFLARGIFVAGTKYMCLKAEAKIAFGKKGGEGVVLGKTTRTVIVCVCDLDKVDIKNSGALVAKLADYLVEKNC